MLTAIEQEHSILEKLVTEGRISADDAELLPTMAELREAYRAAAQALSQRIRADVPFEQLKPDESDLFLVRESLNRRSYLLDENENLSAGILSQFDKADNIRTGLIPGKILSYVGDLSRAYGAIDACMKLTAGELIEFLYNLPTVKAAYKDAAIELRAVTYEHGLKKVLRFMKEDFVVYAKGGSFERCGSSVELGQDIHYGAFYAPFMPERTQKLFRGNSPSA